MVPFLENMKQGCKLEKKELFCFESHACQPAHSALSALISTEAADKQTNQNHSRNKQKSCKEKGVQNKHQSLL